MPCFNSEKYIAESIESILSQDYENFEFIILDDASTDRTREIIQRYTDKRIHFFSSACNQGNYYLRNIGLMKSKGEYISVMDSDDIAISSKISTQLNIMEENRDIGILGSRCEWIDRDGEKLGISNLNYDIEKSKIMMLMRNQFIHPTIFIRNEFLKKYKLSYNENLYYAADYDLIARGMFYFTTLNINEILLKYRIHREQISQKFSHEQFFYSNRVRVNILKMFGVVLDLNQERVYSLMMSGEKLNCKIDISIANRLIDEIFKRNNLVKFFDSELLLHFFKSVKEVTFC